MRGTAALTAGSPHGAPVEAVQRGDARPLRPRGRIAVVTVELQVGRMLQLLGMMVRLGVRMMKRSVVRLEVRLVVGMMELGMMARMRLDIAVCCRG